MRERSVLNRRSVVRTAALAGAATIVVGPGSRAAASTQGTPEAVQPRAEPPAWSVVLHRLDDPYPGIIQAPAQPPPGTRYVAAEIQIDNESMQGLAFTPTDLRLRDAAGYEYRGGTAIGQEPMLSTRNLNGGERSRGWVWFTVSAEAQLAQLVYLAPAPEFRIDLEQ